MRGMPKSLKYYMMIGAIIFMTTPIILWNTETADEKTKSREWAPERIQLEDDFSFIYQQDRSSAITIIQLLVKGGKRTESKEAKGLTFLVNRLCVDVTEPSDIYRLMHKGSSALYHVEGDHSIISLKFLSANLGDSLKIFASTLSKPLITALRIDNIKDLMDYRQKSEDDTPELVLEKTYWDAFFSNNEYGYGGSISGDPASRKNIKRKDAVEMHKQYFNRAHMIISVCSDLPKTDLIPLIQKYFGSFPKGSTEEPITPCFPGSIPGKKNYNVEKEKQQTLVSFGTLLPVMSRENYAMVCILDNLMGKGVGNKLWPLRSKYDLAYNMNTKFYQWKEGGLFYIYLKTHRSKQEPAAAALKEILADIFNKGITAEEFSAAAIQAKMEFLVQNESKENRAYNLGNFESLGVGFSFLDDFFNRVDNITLSQFNDYVKNVLNPERMIEVIIGPKEPSTTN